MAARIAQPLADILRNMWARIERDHPHFVDHFLKNRHISGTLQNHEIVVVAARKFGRAATQATLRQVSVLPGIGRAASSRRLRTGGLSLLCLWRQRRNSTVRRIYNQRSAPAGYDSRSAVVPEVVIRKRNVCFGVLAVAAIGIIVLEHLLFVFSRLFFRK